MLHANDNHTYKKMVAKLPWSLLLLAVALFALVAVDSPNETHAAAVTGFQAGNIMSDNVFTNRSSMSAPQIQSFLNSKVPYCDTYGSKPSEYGGGTRKQYAAARGVSTPFICLRNYSQGGKSAARIIYNTAQEFNINPQVLIVLLQKEQGLVTDEWPWPIQYKTATGYGCPDTAPCDSEYYGFTNQVRWAARMFRAIMNNSSTWYTPYKLGSNRIYWHPDTSRCGSSTVNIQNRTTVALYSYTPYRPNQAALNAGYGVGNSCSSYGNRNFYQYFKDWFGSTHAAPSFTRMSQPRWMQTKGTVYKKNPYTGANSGTAIAAGKQLYFPNKLTVNGKMYLQTEHDANTNSNRGILYEDLEEIPVVFSTMATPRWMRPTETLRRQDPITRRSAGDRINSATAMYFTQKITIGGITHLRSHDDHTNNSQVAVPLGRLTNVDVKTTTMSSPRWMRVIRSTSYVNRATNQTVGTPFDLNDTLHLKYKFTVNGTIFLRENPPSSSSTYIGIPMNDMRNMSTGFTTLSNTQTMAIRTPTRKIDTRTRQPTGGVLAKDRVLTFTSQIYIDGIRYWRTEHDTQAGAPRAIPYNDLKAV